jgi:uncharacterized protein (TIGR03000 family)
MSSVGRLGRDDGEGRSSGPARAVSGALAFLLEGTLARPRVKELEIGCNKRRCIMFRQMFTRVGVPAVFAAVLLMAGPAWARGGGHGGGSHGGGGGGHGGGFHGGGGHGGGFHGASPIGGGFQHGGFDRGSPHVGSVHHRDFHHGDFRHRGFHHGYYPFNGYYSPYGYYPPYDYPYDDLGYGSDPDQGYSYTGGTPSIVSPDAAPAQADSTAHVTVSLPANAELWFDGAQTTSTGPVREFQTPPLTPGQYTYEIRVRWTENGHEVTRTHKIAVSPGAHISLLFPSWSGSN